MRACVLPASVLLTLVGLAGLTALAMPVAAQGEPVLLYSLASPTEEEYGNFGHAVAAITDLDGDGHDDLAVGAPYEDHAAVGSGAVHVFSGATGDLIFTRPGVADRSGSYGWSVADAGDVDGDGTSEIVIGAVDAGFDEAEYGAAFLVSGATGVWLVDYQTPTPRDGGGFGWAVGGIGAADGGGAPDVAVGAYNESPGSLHLFSGRTGQHIRTLADVPSSPILLGDVNGDGRPDLAAGGGFQGAEFYRVHTVRTGALLYQVDDPTPGGDSNFATALAAVGDLDGDGVDDVLAGAPLAYRTQPMPGAAGAAYVFSGATGALLRTLDSPSPTARYGYAVAAPGDVNRDGTPDLIMSAIPDGGGRVFVVSGADGEEIAVLSSPTDPAAFGWSLAVLRAGTASAGAVIAVGAPVASPGPSPESAGRVYVFGFPHPVASAPEPAVASLSLWVSPNPSAGAAHVALTLAAPSTVRVAVVDALGRTVAVVHDGPLSAGRHRLALPAGLAPGVYAVVAESDGGRASGRWVVAR